MIEMIEKIDCEDDDRRLINLKLFSANNLVKTFINRVFYNPFDDYGVVFYCSKNEDTYTTLQKSIMLIEKYIQSGLSKYRMKEQIEKQMLLLPIYEAEVLYDYVRNEFQFKHLTKRFVDITCPGEFE